MTATTETCEELAPLVTLRAAGALDALDPRDARKVEAHLQACEACRADALADAAVLGLARLPPVAEAEVCALDGLGTDVKLELSRGAARRGFVKRVAVVVAVLAAGVVVIFAPAVVPRPVVPPQPVEASWSAPDPDALYAETDVLDVAGSDGSYDVADAADAALAAAGDG